MQQSPHISPARSHSGMVISAPKPTLDLGRFGENVIFSVCRDIQPVRFENESWLSRMRSGQISQFMGRNNLSRFPSHN